MAELIWTEPALSDLDAIADFSALDKPDAAKAFVRRVFSHVEQLQEHPESSWRVGFMAGAQCNRFNRTA